MTSWLIQNVLSVPIKLTYAKCKLKIKYEGRGKLKKFRKQGYFIYGNHTQTFGDTFIISNIVYPKRNFLIVNPENVSIKGVGNFIQMFGAIPIPSNIKATRNFLESIRKKIEKGYSITIFPEAHIWPYYTKIRPFKPVSFRYPAELNVPSFCVTNTYQKKGNGFRIVSYIDGPFYPDENLNFQERKKDLRDRIYNCMVERSQNSNIEFIKYVNSNTNIKL